LSVPECCYSGEYAEFFSERSASRTARQYLRKGLRGSARDLARAAGAAGVQDATILEVGGGVGAIHADLLQAGAAEAVNVELSPSWERPAAGILAAKGLEGRVDRRIGDFVAIADDLPGADIVVLHRVLCCYPDWPAMLGAAMAKSRRLVAITVPVDRWWTRSVVAAENALLRLRGRRFQSFVHPPRHMIRALATDGFDVRSDRAGLVWRTVTAER
jgi:hypothetical protein